MSRISDILYMDEYHEKSIETQDYFEFVHDMILDGYERYDADMRISGLYYRTSSIDIDSMYNVARFTDYNRICDIRNIYDVMKQRTTNGRENINFLDKMEEAFEYFEQCSSQLVEYPFEKPHRLRFKREPKNSYDKNAIQILYKGKHCGYVPKEHAAVLVKQYTTHVIESAYGIIRSKTGDARVTFDMYLQQNKVKAYEAEEGDDWEDEDEWLVKKPIKKPAKTAFEEEDADDVKVDTPIVEEDHLYEGKTRLRDEVTYVEVYKKGRWEPYNGSWTWDKDTNKMMKWVSALNGWEEVSQEERDAVSKRLADERKKQSEPAVDVAVDKPVTGTATMTVNGNMQFFNGTDWIEPLPSRAVATKPVKAKKPVPVPLDYTQFTGFMRTLLEYATFAHVK